MGVDLMTVSMVLCFVWLIWWTARDLDTASRVARQAEAATQRHADETRDLYENAPCDYHSLSASGPETSTVERGDIALAPAGVPHALRNPGPDRLVVLVVFSPPPGGLKA